MAHLLFRLLCFRLDRNSTSRGRATHPERSKQPRALGSNGLSVIRFVGGRQRFDRVVGDWLNTSPLDCGMEHSARLFNKFCLFAYQRKECFLNSKSEVFLYFRGKTKATLAAWLLRGDETLGIVFVTKFVYLF